MYNRNEGCYSIFGIIVFIIFSIVSAFNGKYIPIIIITVIITILWVANIFIKLKSERKKLAETEEGKIVIDENNSKMIISVIIIILGVIISMIFQSNKREYFENKKNEQIEYVTSTIQPTIKNDIIKYNKVQNDTVWLNENLENCYFKLPENFIYQENISNENIKYYLDLNENLSFNVAFGKIPDDAEFKTIDELSQNITSIANNINDNNKLKFDDFVLIDYKIEKLSTVKAIKIEQTSTKISGKNIKMLVTNYNIISGSSYYNITYAYPKDSLKFKNNFEKIKNSFEFQNRQSTEDNIKINQKIKLGEYKVIENINERVYFYNEPDEYYKRKGYLTSGDIVYVEKIENEFGYINFTNLRGLNSKGWIKIKFLEKTK